MAKSKLRIYRHGFKRDGEKVLSQRFYCDLYLPEGDRVRCPLSESKDESERTAGKLAELVSLLAGGELPSIALQNWINGLSPKFQEKLAKWGLISQARVAGRTSLAVHLDDWRAALLAGGTGQKQAQQNHQRVSRVFADAGFRCLSDIAADKVQSIIGQLQKTTNRINKKSGKVERFSIGNASSFSKLHYTRACKQFSKWCFVNGRVSEDVLNHLNIKNVRVQSPRRALCADEIGHLLRYTENAPAIWNVPGIERALVYELAVNTGLRRDEIRSLKRTDFDSKRVCVRVDAEHTKNKRPALLPIKAALMDRIAEHYKNKLPGASIFSIPDAASKMLKKDMESARALWIDDAKNNPAEHQRRYDSDFLRVETHAGKADFHSLRHSFGTLLAESGVHPKVAMDLMRHSDINLTMSLYTHSNQEQATAAIDALPTFESEPIQNSKKA